VRVCAWHGRSLCGACAPVGIITILCNITKDYLLESLARLEAYIRVRLDARPVPPAAVMQCSFRCRGCWCWLGVIVMMVWWWMDR
jgi:hypothetical protein